MCSSSPLEVCYLNGYKVKTRMKTRPNSSEVYSYHLHPLSKQIFAPRVQKDSSSHLVATGWDLIQVLFNSVDIQDMESCQQQISSRDEKKRLLFSRLWKYITIIKNGSENDRNVLFPKRTVIDISLSPSSEK